MVFEKNEWADIKRQVEFYFEDSDTYAVFDHLYKHRHKLENLTSTEEIVKKHFPNMLLKIYLNHLSKLNQIVEDYLVIEETKHEKYTYDLMLLKAQNRRSLYNNADQTMRKIEKKISEQKGFDIENSKALTTLLDSQYYSNNSIKYERGAALLQQLLDTFHAWYKEQSLLYKAELYNWGRIKKHDFSETIDRLDSSIAALADTEISKELELTVSLQQELQVDNLYTIKKHLNDNNYDRKSLLHLIVASYLIARTRVAIKTKKTTDVNFLKSNYTYGLENGVFTDAGKISLPTFSNLVGIICEFSSLEEGDAFIEKWVHQVSTKNIEALTLFSKAKNRFRHERYDEILEYTRYGNFESIHKIEAQILTLIALIMDKYMSKEIIESTIVNLKITSKRNKQKMSGSKYTGLSNLILFVEKYINDKTKAKIFYESCEDIWHRTWCVKVLK